jgi:excisionase family DNA binding protein
VDETDGFLTVAEVADMLRLNQQTVRNTIDRGELAAVRVGPRRVRIRKSDLDRFISESAAMMGPTQDEARAEFSEAQEAVRVATTNEDLRPALQRLAVAATKLARALPRG